MSSAPDHHLQDGSGFRNPWPEAAAYRQDSGSFLRWRMDRLRNGIPPTPPPSAFPFASPEIAEPWAQTGELRVSWVGHATFLVQLPGFSVLTDPIWSRRASPVPWAGPSRIVPAAFDFDRLPDRLHAVVISHDHYDHLDRPTVRRLVRRYGGGTTWIAPLGHGEWLRRRGADRVIELDWWEEAELQGDAGVVRATALPARHWCARSPMGSRRLWASWALRGDAGGSVYFAGDSGYFPGYSEIGERAGPFDVALMPIGAYRPRWFMERAHMNPEDAVRAYTELGATGVFVPMHWGTFRLADEAPLEPPELTRQAWAEAGLPAEHLRILRHGETLVVRPASRGSV